MTEWKQMWTMCMQLETLQNGTGIVAGLWQPAMDQGKVAGKNMASSSAEYQQTIPSTVFNAFGFSCFSIGLVNENECDTTLV